MTKNERATTPTLLIVDDEKTQREGLRAALEERYDVYLADDTKTAMDLLEKDHFDVLLTDFRLPNEDGMKLIARAKSLSRPPICILMTAYGSEELAVEAMKRGADDYIPKGRLQIDELEMKIARALRQQSLEVENVSLRQQLNSRYGMENVVGESSAMKEVLDVVQQVAPARTTVLLEGESGTGKELIAKVIHRLSPRAQQPMVTVHCAALSPTLLESELFGHEKGAFTGAYERRIGRFEQAQGGTLFLDEIGEIDASTQIKLLRFLGERSFERVGSNKTLSADVRLIAATNKNLEDLVRKGTFREDLFFRLRVFEIRLPALRDRPEDVPLLAQAFLREFAEENNKPVYAFTADALELLQRYSWPGNVRELRAAIEHAVVLCRSEKITARDLPAQLRQGPEGAGAGPARETMLSNLTVDEAEKELIIRALKETNGNRTLAARKIGMSRRSLHRKLHLYHLEGI
jgi:DNA-binding NtrC family response regulator